MPRRRSLAGFVLLLTACSSPPPLPAAEYFPAIEAELARLDLATRDLTDRYAAELEAEIESLMSGGDSSGADSGDRLLEAAMTIAAGKMQAIIEAHAGQVEVFIARVDELIPPETVGAEHAELIGAFRSWAESGEATVAQLGVAGNLNGLAHTLQQSPYADAQLRVDEACRGLLDAAAAVDVILTCPGTELQPLEVGS